MDELQQPKRTRAVFAGFLAVCGVLALLTVLPRIAPDLSLAIGRGGWPYVNAVAGAGVIGGLLMGLHPQRGWKAFGKGMVLGALFGVVAMVVLIVLFLLTWHSGVG